MVLGVLALACVGALGWLLADALRENHLRYTVEDEKWHAAFERILAAPVPPGPLPGRPDAGSVTDETHDWRLLPAQPEHRPSESIE